MLKHSLNAVFVTGICLENKLKLNYKLKQKMCIYLFLITAILICSLLLSSRFTGFGLSEVHVLLFDIAGRPLLPALFSILLLQFSFLPERVVIRLTKIGCRSSPNQFIYMLMTSTHIYVHDIHPYIC